MASIFKRGADKKIRRANWWISFTDSTSPQDPGKRRTVKGCPDRLATEGMARKLEADAALRRAGVITAKDVALVGHEPRPLAEHLEDWHADLVAKATIQKHADLTRARVQRVAELGGMKRLADLRVYPES